MIPKLGEHTPRQPLALLKIVAFGLDLPDHRHPVPVGQVPHLPCHFRFLLSFRSFSPSIRIITAPASVRMTAIAPMASNMVFIQLPPPRWRSSPLSAGRCSDGSTVSRTRCDWRSSASVPARFHACRSSWPQWHPLWPPQACARPFHGPFPHLNPGFPLSSSSRCLPLNA